MYIIYNIILTLALILYIPIILYKLFKGKYNKELKERFGIISNEIKDQFHNKPTIWIHAVSVGETVAASSVVKKLRSEFPEYKILFSTVTTSGQEMAHKIIEENVDNIIYFPLDLSFIVKKALVAINPDLIIIMETELWPNFIKNASENGSKIMYVNGRISGKSFKLYKYLGPILNDMLSKIDFLSMQSSEDLERIIELGATKNKVINSGNTKFDQTYAEPDKNKIQKYRQEFKIDEDQTVLVAGSTHDDEEENLLNIYLNIKKDYPNLIFILAPRHIDRSADIEKLYQNKNISVIKRTEVQKRNKEDVIILDTIGELAQIYSIADLVFVGGSMMGKGGHNILEPAAQGKLVFFGKDMFNFKDSTKLLLDNDVGIQVETWDELNKELNYYLDNPEILAEKGEKAREVILQNRGASSKNVELAVELLSKNTS
ncbi:MAG: 3-deoxy-D-manno-octulosonic acid transferase [Bacillota bacterium]